MLRVFYFAPALSPRMTLDVKPACSISFSPLIVTPPGVVTRSMAASGCIHPGSPEMIQLLPEEDRSEDFIAVYTDFTLSLGENDGGITYTTPDRIVWNGQTWRLVHLKDWPTFNYYQGVAVRVKD